MGNANSKKDVLKPFRILLEHMLHQLYVIEGNPQDRGNRNELKNACTRVKNKATAMLEEHENLFQTAGSRYELTEMRNELARLETFLKTISDGDVLPRKSTAQLIDWSKASAEAIKTVLIRTNETIDGFFGHLKTKFKSINTKLETIVHGILQFFRLRAPVRHGAIERNQSD